MAKLTLSKSELQKQSRQLKLYEGLLPSLELKRRQLTLEIKKAADILIKLQGEGEQLKLVVATQLPMLANEEINLKGLMSLSEVNVATENVSGVKLPLFKGVDCEVVSYSRLSMPVWVDSLVEYLLKAVELKVQMSVANQRVEKLQSALKNITQRVNLFEKILIPNAKVFIKHIQIFLGDQQRDAVVRSKLAKRKQLDIADTDVQCFRSVNGA